jgi:hypothetical protein
MSALIFLILPLVSLSQYDCVQAGPGFGNIYVTYYYYYYYYSLNVVVPCSMCDYYDCHSGVNSLKN